MIDQGNNLYPWAWIEKTRVKLDMWKNVNLDISYVISEPSSTPEMVAAAKELKNATNLWAEALVKKATENDPR